MGHGADALLHAVRSSALSGSWRCAKRLDGLCGLSVPACRPMSAHPVPTGAARSRVALWPTRGRCGPPRPAAAGQSYPLPPLLPTGDHWLRRHGCIDKSPCMGHTSRRSPHDTYSINVVVNLSAHPAQARIHLDVDDNPLVQSSSPRTGRVRSRVLPQRVEARFLPRRSPLRHHPRRRRHLHTQPHVRPGDDHPHGDRCHRTRTSASPRARRR